MTEPEQQLHALRAEAEAAIAGCTDLPALDQLKAKYLGQHGSVTGILGKLGSLPKEQKPVIGKLANEVKTALTAAIAGKREELESQIANLKSPIDTTLPGRRRPLGHQHPLTQVFERTALNDAEEQRVHR